MISSRKLVFLGGLVLAFGLTTLRRAEAAPPAMPLVTVRLTVELPAGTPTTDTIYLAGNLTIAGEWKADGLPLERSGPRTAVGFFTMTASDRLEFKITRGSWNTVERDTLFDDIANRSYRPSEDATPGETRTLSISVANWADSAPPRPATITGDIRVHEAVASRHLEKSRAIRVWLPPGYDSSSNRYPVLYMHDAQNIFDASTSFLGVEWGVDEACQELVTSGRIPPLIVVGIDNTDKRVDEYTTAAMSPRGGGAGDSYSLFLVSELKPFIDGHYRTKSDRAHTTVMGSSLGGLISLHLAWKFPEIFSAAGVVSPALWWADREIIRRLANESSPQPRPRFWIDMGTAEGDTHSGFIEGITDIRELGVILSKKGFIPDRDFTVREYEGAVHSERAWSARIREILLWLYSSDATASAAR